MRSDRALRSVLALALAVSFAACGGSSDDDASEPVASADPTEPAATDDEAEPTPSEPAAEPTPTEPVMPEPTDPPVTEPPVTEPPVTEPADEPSPTVAPDETVVFDRNAAFRDEFDGAFLPEAGWTWLGEEADRWRFEDGHLVIVGDNPHFMGEPVNLLTRVVPDEMEVAISARVTAAPQENFEATGITLFNEQGEYVAVLLGFCDFCLPDSVGIGIFGEAMSGEDNLLTEPASNPDGRSNPVTLTLDWSPGNGVVVAGYRRFDDEFIRIFRLEDAPEFTSFGLFAHNLPSGGENLVDIEGRFDWFELKVYEP
jgi:hypothetical protein